MTFPGPILTSPVVSTQWLADHLGADNLIIVDASVAVVPQPAGPAAFVTGHEQYIVGGHIPGAFFADLIESFSDVHGDHPFTKPSAAQFAAAAGALGVCEGTTVVVYDSSVGQWASRLWWLFRAFGFDSVAVLDGGYSKWTAESRETEARHIEPVAATFTALERPELWVDKAHVEGVVNGEVDAALVCGLPPQEFSGEAGFRARLGHIPGSVNAPAGRLVDRATNALLPTDALQSIFAPVLDQPQVIAYCAAGIAASADALALTLLGHTNVAIYDGSLNEWASDESTPLSAPAA